ncbi:MFS multidrug transporter [Aureobasidium pullulans]|nr:MFS multidrug transporter [Aureobasidium pullulans]
MEDDNATTLQPIRTGRSARQYLSRTRSNKSNRSTKSRSRSGSRPSRPSSPLQRLTSANFIDDHGIYHHHADSDYEVEIEERESEHGGSDDLSPQSSSDLEKEKEKQEPDEIPIEPFGAETARDLEAQSEKEDPPALSRKSTSKSVKDPNLVGWDGPDDPENPKNWGKGRKWAATLVVSSFTFISPVSSSMVAPAIGVISSDFNITSTAEQQLVLSIFVLAYAIGPLFLGPMSELYGRVRVLQIANAFYFVWNLACGFAQNKSEMMAFRFLAGLGGSAPLAIGGGMLSDCWRPEERGKAISIYSLAPLLGPAVGPIAGGFIAENTTWRWVFWSTCIACFFIQLSGVFFLQETYVPELLKRKKNRLIKETGNTNLHTEYDDPNRKLSVHLKTAFTRPFVMIGTQPIVQFLAIYIAYVYGLMYLVLSTFPGLWTGIYGESTGIGGLNYISLGLGFFLGTQIGAPFNDYFYRRLKKQNNNVGRSEFRVPLMFPGSVLIPIGLFIYGWTAEYKTHWIGPNIGAAIFSAGNILVFQSCQTYIIDSYQRYAASAVASTTVLRSLAGFGFPLFAPSMYSVLGYGWGNSVLGFIAVGLGLPAPFILWKFGERLRARSKFASGS